MSTLYYNRGKGESEHLNMNIKMFKELGITCVSFRIIPMTLFRRGDILYLNWYENIYNGNIIVAFGQYLVKTAILNYAKLSGVRIFASQHNKEQHDAKHPKLSNRMYRKIYKSSERIIVFSKSGAKDLEKYISLTEAKQKAYYIPPVNYIGCYEYKIHEWISEIGASQCMKILFVGSLNHPYKNVDMVIDIAKEFKTDPILFIFAGKVANREQVNAYQDKVRNESNIIGEFRFIRDDEMAQLLDVADIVIMPYDIASISNSGTARLAFSYGKTIICPDIPSLESIPHNLIYTYSYNSKEEHKNKVKEMIDQAFQDYLQDRSTLVEKGNKLREIMAKQNSQEVVQSRYLLLFN